MERLTLIPGQLQTLAITLARADELPGIMARCACRLDARGSGKNKPPSVIPSACGFACLSSKASCGRDFLASGINFGRR
jgi:hypothetical protein